MSIVDLAFPGQKTPRTLIHSFTSKENGTQKILSLPRFVENLHFLKISEYLFKFKNITSQSKKKEYNTFLNYKNNPEKEYAEKYHFD
jgi:hypothetical protein